MKKFLLVLSIIGVSVIVLFISVLGYVWYKSDKDSKSKSDVILVLGGHVISGTSCTGSICKQKGFVMKSHPNPCVVGRVDHAVKLYKVGYAPKIFMSGGTDKETQANEAETMKKWAVESGVPEKDILIENKSTSTYENLLLSRNVLNKEKLKSVIVVTEPYHIARAGLVASKLGYDYSLSPTTENVCWNKDNFFANWNFIKKEPLAIIGYKLLNKL